MQFSPPRCELNETLNYFSYTVTCWITSFRPRVPVGWVRRSQNDTEDQPVVQCSPDTRQCVQIQVLGMPLKLSNTVTSDS